MLSDRIKKFGVKARENENKLFKKTEPKTAESISESSKSDQISASENKQESPRPSSESVKKVMEDARQKSSSAQSVIIDTYIEKKLSEIDRKQAEKERQASLQDKSVLDSDTVISENKTGEDSGSGVPLLFRYSAALQNMRLAAEEENLKSEKSTDYPEDEKCEIKSSATVGDMSDQNTQSVFNRSFSDNSMPKTNSLSENNSTESIKDKNAQQDASFINEASDTDTINEKVNEIEADEYADSSVLFDLQWSGRKNEDLSTHSDKEIEEPEKSNKKPKRMIPAKSCIYAPLLAVVTELLAIASSKISISSLERRDNIYIALVVIQLLVYIIPGIFYCKLRHKNDISTLRLSMAKPDRLYFAVVAAFTLFAVSAAFKLLYIQLGIYKSDFAAYASYINISTFSSASDILYMIITFVFIPAVSKEFIFRSVIFGEYMNDGVGYIAPAVISSVMYAMIYFRIAAFPKYFIIGMILSLTSLIADSVIISMAASTIYGLLDVFSESYIANLMRSDYKLLLVFVTVAMLLLFITLFFAEAERLFFNKGTAGDPSPVLKIRKEKLSVFLRSAFCRPSFLVCTVLFLLGVIVNAI